MFDELGKRVDGVVVKDCGNQTYDVKLTRCPVCETEGPIVRGILKSKLRLRA